MGKIKGKWQGQLKAAQASGLSLAEYAAQHGIDVRRLYEARYARARAQAAQARKASAFARIKLKRGSPVDGTSDAHPTVAAATLEMQAKLRNGVVLSWTHDAGDGRMVADLMHTLAALPCSA